MGQCNSPRYWQFLGDPFRLLQAQYGITLSNVGGAKDWTQQNAWKAYDTVSNIDSALNGQLAANIRGANVTFRMQEQDPTTGTYHGRTGGTTVDFFTIGDDAIRQQNIYHEFGHVLDNVPGLADYSGALGAANPAWAGINRDLAGNVLSGDINAAALSHTTVADPSGGIDEALQHPHPNPNHGDDVLGELWADALANYVAGNLDVGIPGGPGISMYNWVHNELSVNFAAP